MYDWNHFVCAAVFMNVNLTNYTLWLHHWSVSEWAHGNKIHLKLGIIKNFTGNGQKKISQNSSKCRQFGCGRSPICPWPHGLHIPQCCLNKWPRAAAAAAITASPAVTSSGQPLWPRLTLTLALAPQSALHWTQVLNIEADTVSNMWYRNLEFLSTKILTDGRL